MTMAENNPKIDIVVNNDDLNEDKKHKVPCERPIKIIRRTALKDGTVKVEECVVNRKFKTSGRRLGRRALLDRISKCEDIDKLKRINELLDELGM